MWNSSHFRRFLNSNKLLTPLSVEMKIANRVALFQSFVLITAKAGFRTECELLDGLQACYFSQVRMKKLNILRFIFITLTFYCIKNKYWKGDEI